MAKNLLLWMVIAAVLLTVFNNINQETSSVSVTYSDFVKEVRAGQVRSVTIAGISVTGRRMDNTQFTTTIPMIGDDQLMNDLSTTVSKSLVRSRSGRAFGRSCSWPASLS